MRQPTRPRAAALARKLAAAGGVLRSDGRDSLAHLDRRLAALEARMGHLETALEGLQDALYRQAVREDESVAELRERTEPARIARELSADARRRGL